jgi:hypothetical protein
METIARLKEELRHYKEIVTFLLIDIQTFVDLEIGSGVGSRSKSGLTDIRTAPYPSWNGKE